MAYNNRMSQQFHGTQQHHNRSRKKDDDNDALMRLVSPALAFGEYQAPFTTVTTADSVAA